MKCQRCGTEFEGRFCPECGMKAEPVQNYAAPVQPFQQQGYQGYQQTEFSPPPFQQQGYQGYHQAEFAQPPFQQQGYQGYQQTGFIPPPFQQQEYQQARFVSPPFQQQEYQNYQQTEFAQPSRSRKTKKTKKPFFLRWWFILIVVAALVAIIGMFSGKKDKKENDTAWVDMELGSMIPMPPSDIDTLYENSDERLWVTFEEVSDKQYNDYLDACIDKGFTLDASKSSYSYKAYNTKGYCLDMSHIGNDLSIDLSAPMELGIIAWPTSAAGNQLPAPSSTTGKFSFEHDDSFFVYVGDMPKTDYDVYVAACSDMGFNVDYSKDDNYYRAYNAEGWHVSLQYEGNSIMSVRVDAPDEVSRAEAIAPEHTVSPALPAEAEPTPVETIIDKPEGMVATTKGVVATEPSETDEPAPTEAIEDKKDHTSGEINPEFKAAMDSYEAFMDEYVSFMEKYDNNPSDLGLLTDYASYMSKYAEFVADFEKWEEEDLNTAETAYYIEVQSRVTQKMLNVLE